MSAEKAQQKNNYNSPFRLLDLVASDKGFPFPFLIQTSFHSPLSK